MTLQIATYADMIIFNIVHVLMTIAHDSILSMLRYCPSVRPTHG